MLAAGPLATWGSILFRLNLLTPVDFQENKHTTCLVMESCSGGDLASLLEGRQGTKLDEQDIQMMVVQVPGHQRNLCEFLHR